MVVVFLRKQNCLESEKSSYSIPYLAAPCQDVESNAVDFCLYKIYLDNVVCNRSRIKNYLHMFTIEPLCNDFTVISHIKHCSS